MTVNYHRRNENVAGQFPPPRGTAEQKREESDEGQRTPYPTANASTRLKGMVNERDAGPLSPAAPPHKAPQQSKSSGSLERRSDGGGTIAFHRVAAAAEALGREEEEEEEEEEEQEQERPSQDHEKEAPMTAVRKILHPTEALDSARHAAELIMKDAMEALQRTKQRLMEILPSLSPFPPTSAASGEAMKPVEEVVHDLPIEAEGEVRLPRNDEADFDPRKVVEASTPTTTDPMARTLRSSTKRPIPPSKL